MSRSKDLATLANEELDGLTPSTRRKLAVGLKSLAGDMEAHGKDRDAPMREVFARLGDRWSLLLLLVLRLCPLRHAALRKLVAALSAEGAISQRMLTLKLRALERDGLVTRSTSTDVPPQVTYALSPMGAELLGHADLLMQWVKARGGDIRGAREAFRRRNRALGE